MRTYKVELLITAENPSDATEQIEDIMKDCDMHIVGIEMPKRYYVITPDSIMSKGFCSIKGVKEYLVTLMTCFPKLTSDCVLESVRVIRAEDNEVIEAIKRKAIDEARKVQ